MKYVYVEIFVGEIFCGLYPKTCKLNICRVLISRISEPSWYERSRLLLDALSSWKRIHIIRGFHIYGDSWSPVIGGVLV